MLRNFFKRKKQFASPRHSRNKAYVVKHESSDDDIQNWDYSPASDSEHRSVEISHPIPIKSNKKDTEKSSYLSTSAPESSHFNAKQSTRDEDMYTVLTGNDVVSQTNCKHKPPSHTTLHDWYNTAVIPHVGDKFSKIAISPKLPHERSRSASNDESNNNTKKSFSSFQTPQNTRKHITEYEHVGNSVKISRKLSAGPDKLKNDRAELRRTASASASSRQAYMSVNAPSLQLYKSNDGTNSENSGESSNADNGNVHNIRLVPGANEFSFNRTSQYSDSSHTSQGTSSSFSTTSSDNTSDDLDNVFNNTRNRKASSSQDNSWMREAAESSQGNRRDTLISSCSNSSTSDELIERLEGDSSLERRSSKRSLSFRRKSRSSTKRKVVKENKNSPLLANRKYDPSTIFRVTIEIIHGVMIGLKLGGGSITAYGDSNIHVVEVLREGTAFNLLRTGDELLEVNGASVEGLTLFETNRLLKNLPPGPADIIIHRPKNVLPW